MKYLVTLGLLTKHITASSEDEAIELARAEWKQEWPNLYTEISNKKKEDFECYQDT